MNWGSVRLLNTSKSEYVLLTPGEHEEQCSEQCCALIPDLPGHLHPPGLHISGSGDGHSRRRPEGGRAWRGAWTRACQPVGVAWTPERREAAHGRLHQRPQVPRAVWSVGSPDKIVSTCVNFLIEKFMVYGIILVLLLCLSDYFVASKMCMLCLYTYMRH